jgi:quercetin dioxygenase-like cupin family protein
MLYRDLIPDRQGGRFIASHIRIAEGGPVPDYVHHHAIRFQLIYCYRGWVRVVYEDQGPPFVLHPGDCVLQPPHIRHRVLESSPGLEVIEVSSPATHATIVDHELTLPTPRRERQYGGQRFVHHRAADAVWRPWHSGLAARDLGIAAATGGIASAHVARPHDRATAAILRHGGELRFLFTLAGAVTLDCKGGRRLVPGDAAVIPAGLDHAFADPSADLELLEIDLPAI